MQVDTHVCASTLRVLSSLQLPRVGKRKHHNDEKHVLFMFLGVMPTRSCSQCTTTAYTRRDYIIQAGRLAHASLLPELLFYLTRRLPRS